MFSFRRTAEKGFEVYEVYNEKGITAKFIPERGGLLTEYFMGDIPLFYLDSSTLFDNTKNVRGGNPVLFPICGPLENDRYVLEGREYQMKQHGLARTVPWQAEEPECFRDSARINLYLESNKATKSMYPFDFRLEFSYFITEGTIIIEQKYFNCSDQEMPFYAGFHPYFYAPGGKAVNLHIPARRCFDIKSGKTKVFRGIPDFDAVPETNLVFGSLQGNEACFDRSDGFRVTVRYDDSFSYIVLWVLRDREFVCLEPWMGDNYDMNRGRAVRVKPGCEYRAVVSYSISQIF
ncbi:hypothetical protein [Phosphitispora sp. TUW77]|uniref:aldose epimerase family protein n=1 Tax=Phosphitispora sp. TUW77 TaxID=3152361 RepID=UPI003AB4C9D7